MKKLISVIMIGMMVFSSPMAFADIDDVIGSAAESTSISHGGSADSRSNSDSRSSANAAQQQGQLQGQAQGQMQGQAAIAAQGQGQLGIVGQKSTNDQSVNVGGDTQKNTAYVMTAPNTVAGDGQSAMSACSIFGGLNLADSAEYKECIEKIRVVSQMSAANLITTEVAKAEAWEAYQQMKESTQPKRVLGVLWKTRGRHIFNGFGMLSTDSAPVNSDNLFGLKKT